MRKIGLIIEIEDNDYIEQALFKELDGTFGSSMVSYEKLRDTSRLYDEDETYRKICKAVKLAKKVEKDYFYNQQLKPKQ